MRAVRHRAELPVTGPLRLPRRTRSRTASPQPPLQSRRHRPFARSSPHLDEVIDAVGILLYLLARLAGYNLRRLLYALLMKILAFRHEPTGISTS